MQWSQTDFQAKDEHESLVPLNDLSFEEGLLYYSPKAILTVLCTSEGMRSQIANAPAPVFAKATCVGKQAWSPCSKKVREGVSRRRHRTAAKAPFCSKACFAKACEGRCEGILPVYSPHSHQQRALLKSEAFMGYMRDGHTVGSHCVHPFEMNDFQLPCHRSTIGFQIEWFFRFISRS